MKLVFDTVLVLLIISGNAINHLASAEHLKNLKHFLWKYGGGMDSVDKFRILEADLAKVFKAFLQFSGIVFESDCIAKTIVKREES